MSKRFQIQTLADAGHTHNQIALLANVSPRSVARILKEPPIVTLDDAPLRKTRRLGRPSKVEPFRKLVHKCLDDDPTLPSVEILHRAKQAGYEGQKSALYALVQQLRTKTAKFTMRFEAVPGEFSQHDFGQVNVTYLNGHTETLIFLATRLKFSRWVQVSLTPDQKAETLVRTVCHHFAAIGGVPLFAVFDRPKTVALQWKKDGTITKYNPIFQQALFDMGVCPEVCWPYSPEQKGAVENLVGWVKGSFFKVRRFQDRHDLIAQLDAWHHEANFERKSRATGVPPQSRMAAERARLRPLKVMPDQLSIRRPVQVGPSAMVSIDGSLYSVHPQCTGATGTAFIFADRIIFEVGQHSALHPRSPSPGSKSVLPEHRRARLKAVKGARGKSYLKRQDILDIGEVAHLFISELVHQNPKGWFKDVDVLHELLQAHGEGMLRLGFHMAMAAGRLSSQAVVEAIESPSKSSKGVVQC